MLVRVPIGESVIYRAQEVLQEIVTWRRGDNLKPGPCRQPFLTYCKTVDCVGCTTDLRDKCYSKERSFSMSLARLKPPLSFHLVVRQYSKHRTSMHVGAGVIHRDNT
jgi:hypothetical protein